MCCKSFEELSIMISKYVSEESRVIHKFQMRTEEFVVLCKWMMNIFNNRTVQKQHLHMTFWLNCPFLYVIFHHLYSFFPVDLFTSQQSYSFWHLRLMRMEKNIPLVSSGTEIFISSKANKVKIKLKSFFSTAQMIF